MGRAGAERTVAENHTRPRGTPITIKSLASCALCGAVLILLPWPAAFGIMALAVLVGPGRRWRNRVRNAGQPVATDAQSCRALSILNGLRATSGLAGSKRVERAPEALEVSRRR